MNIPPKMMREVGLGAKRPQIFTGNELRDEEFPPISWAIPGILPAGVTLFGGREKMGKSWLGFSLCIAVATGGYALGKIPVEKGLALYLSLEDPKRRLHKRIRRLAREDTDLGGLRLTTEWSPADRGGVDDLDEWLEENQGCRLVVIDTLKRIRPQASGKRNMYDDDYEALQPFVPLATKHNTAIVVLHHLNQQSEPHDPFDAFSGSSGLTAATEQIWLLTRRRGDADAYLMIDGKDIEDPQELALGWDAATCAWTAQGDAQTYRLNKERREIVELLEREDEPMGPKAVAELLGKGYDATKQMMKRMYDDGQLTQEGYGKYVPSLSSSSHSSHSSHSSNEKPISMGTHENTGESLLENNSHPSTNGSRVTGASGGSHSSGAQSPLIERRVTRVTEVTPPQTSNNNTHLDADKGNERVQRLIDEGVAPHVAVDRVLKGEIWG
jgi:AAA domain